MPPVQKKAVDLTDMQVGLGIGCTIAILLMIFSCILCIIEVYKYMTDGPTPCPPKPKPDDRLPTTSERPPSYTTVVRSEHRDLSATRHDLSTSAHSHVRPYPPIRPISHLSTSAHPHIRPDPPKSSVSHLPTPDPSRKPVINCLLPVCQEYFQSLNLNHYFRKETDCYCNKCHSDKRRNVFKRGGYDSTIPYGWIRFRIETDRAFSQNKKIFQHWATSYYGTREEKLEQLLRNRSMPLPGDRLLDGSTFTDYSGYESQWLTSPSINYASHPRFSPIKTFRLPSKINEIYNVQVVLQCKQKPGSFDIQRGIPGICDAISDQVIEWKSDKRATLVPIGLMVRMVRRDS